jgi:hypothetical protein
MPTRKFSFIVAMAECGRGLGAEQLNGGIHA